MSSVAESVWDNDLEGFEERDEVQYSLAAAAVMGLKRNANREVVIDCTGARKPLKGSVLLAIGLMLAKEIKATIKEDRVGIILPPGAGGMLVNLGVVLAGKSPVNLNFTLGRDALESCIRRSGVKTVYTAKALMDKAPHVPWPEDTRNFAEWMKNLSKFKILLKMLEVIFTPDYSLIKRYGIEEEGGHDEAALLFTSGSVGEPKGVPLSHANILGNIEQIADAKVLHDEDRVIACLPIFHSFGFTVTLFYPLVHGLTVITTPSPLEVGKIIRLIEEEQATVHIATPTFFRPYLKKAKPEQMKSLRGVVAGAEKTPDGFHDLWEKAFPGCAYLEGYGLTETTPVVACNLPGKGTRRASVGKLFPGMAVRIIDPETREPLPVTQQGLICFQGINVFNGYMNMPELNEECFDGDWFVTGDLGRMDADGFLYIEGRLSRFSKIGGEMVPHRVVEQAIAKALDIEDAEKQLVAVCGKRDDAKGEVLVLVSSIDVDMSSLRDKIQAANIELSNLWIPRSLVKVEELPMLPSGKLDLKQLSTIATS